MTATEEVDWDAVGYICSSTYRTEVVSELATAAGPMTPTALTDALGCDIAQVSRALGELDDEDIAECLNPGARKGRLYDLTARGERLADQLDTMEATAR